MNDKILNNLKEYFKTCDEYKKDLLAYKQKNKKYGKRIKKSEYDDLIKEKIIKTKRSTYKIVQRIKSLANNLGLDPVVLLKKISKTSNLASEIYNMQDDDQYYLIYMIYNYEIVNGVIFKSKNSDIFYSVTSTLVKNNKKSRISLALYEICRDIISLFISYEDISNLLKTPFFTNPEILNLIDYAVKDYKNYQNLTPSRIASIINLSDKKTVSNFYYFMVNFVKPCYENLLNNKIRNSRLTVFRSAYYNEYQVTTLGSIFVNAFTFGKVDLSLEHAMYLSTFINDTDFTDFLSLFYSKNRNTLKYLSKDNIKDVLITFLETFYPKKQVKLLKVKIDNYLLLTKDKELMANILKKISFIVSSINNPQDEIVDVSLIKVSRLNYLRTMIKNKRNFTYMHDIIDSLYNPDNYTYTKITQNYPIPDDMFCLVDTVDNIRIKDIHGVNHDIVFDRNTFSCLFFTKNFNIAYYVKNEHFLRYCIDNVLSDRLKQGNLTQDEINFLNNMGIDINNSETFRQYRLDFFSRTDIDNFVPNFVDTFNKKYILDFIAESKYVSQREDDFVDMSWSRFNMDNIAHIIIVDKADRKKISTSISKDLLNFIDDKFSKFPKSIYPKWTYDKIYSTILQLRKSYACDTFSNALHYNIIAKNNNSTKFNKSNGLRGGIAYHSMYNINMISVCKALAIGKVYEEFNIDRLEKVYDSDEFIDMIASISEQKGLKAEQREELKKRLKETLEKNSIRLAFTFEDYLWYKGITLEDYLNSLNIKYRIIKDVKIIQA